MDLLRKFHWMFQLQRVVFKVEWAQTHPKTQKQHHSIK